MEKEDNSLTSYLLPEYNMVWLVKYKVRPREGGKANIPATWTNKIAMVKY